MVQLLTQDGRKGGGKGEANEEAKGRLGGGKRGGGARKGRQREGK